MAPKKKWFEKFSNQEMVLTKENTFNPFANLIETPSPSVNMVFGSKGHGLPRGYSAIFYGPPGGGKSLLSNLTIGQLHKNSLTAKAVKFDTEFRDNGQLTPAQMKLLGIDEERYCCLQSNSPMDVFDTIEKDIPSMIQDGEDIQLIIIDSLTGIRGRRGLDQTSIEGQQIGDKALTLQTGLERIIGIQRKYHIAIIMTAHVGAEMDILEQKRGNKVKMVAGFGVQHHAEYFVYVEMNRNKEARSSLLDENFVDGNRKDLAGNEEKTGAKHRVVMKKNSLSAAGRVGEFTFDYEKGVINTHEEVFLLGVNRGIIAKPTAQSYEFDGKKWVGKREMIMALRDYPELAQKVLVELRKADMEGRFAQTSEEASFAAPE
jgi:RecA/RadA recombinase